MIIFKILRLKTIVLGSFLYALLWFIIYEAGGAQVQYRNQLDYIISINFAN